MEGTMFVLIDGNVFCSARASLANGESCLILQKRKLRWLSQKAHQEPSGRNMFVCVLSCLFSFFKYDVDRVCHTGVPQTVNAASCSWWALIAFVKCVNGALTSASSQKLMWAFGFSQRKLSFPLHIRGSVNQRSPLSIYPWSNQSRGWVRGSKRLPILSLLHC